MLRRVNTSTFRFNRPTMWTKSHVLFESQRPTSKQRQIKSSEKLNTADSPTTWEIDPNRTKRQTVSYFIGGPHRQGVLSAKKTKILHTAIGLSMPNKNHRSFSWTFQTYWWVWWGTCSLCYFWAIAMLLNWKKIREATYSRRGPFLVMFQCHSQQTHAPPFQ